MITKVLLKKIGNTYDAQTHRIENLALDHLGMFLAGDVRSYSNLSWITDPTFEGANFNEGSAYSDDDPEYLIISSQYFDDIIPEFRIKRETFLRLCHAWIKASMQDPNIIELTQENNKFIFEFDTKDGHQKIVVE